MKLILEFDGELNKFERALSSEDDNFTLLDSIYWLLDYGENDEDSVHRTRYGDIKIRKE